MKEMCLTPCDKSNFRRNKVPKNQIRRNLGNNSFDRLSPTKRTLKKTKKIAAAPKKQPAALLTFINTTCRLYSLAGIYSSQSRNRYAVSSQSMESQKLRGPATNLPENAINTF